jgi:hypothetical protein
MDAAHIQPGKRGWPGKSEKWLSQLAACSLELLAICFLLSAIHTDSLPYGHPLLVRYWPLARSL